jgi:pimeloyl-ACP methyl ester carboxylesterase
VAALASALGLRGALGVGHSVGGHAMTVAAALNPQAFASLVLLDPVIFHEKAYTGPWAGASIMSKRRNYWASPEEMFDRFKDRAPFRSWDRRVLRDYCDYGLASHDDGFVLGCPPEVEASVYEHNSVPESNIYPEIATIQIPVRVIRSSRQYEGGADMAASPTAPDLASRFRCGADLRLEGVTHLIPMEAPARVAELIRESLQMNLSQSA